MEKEVNKIDMNAKLAGKNAAQKEAIESPMTTDILISAGAGSGKTKTLSTRVAVLIEQGLIEPSELLILTFTDNAAHEMKERIIQEIHQDEENDHKDYKGDQMYSAHIQTFDSFASYLVKRYASKLGIGNNVLNAPENIIEAKTNSIIDKIFNDYYSSPETSEKITKTLVKFCSTSDETFKKTVRGVYAKLKTFTPKNKKNFIENYDEQFLNKEFFDRCVENYVNDKKKIINKCLYQIYIRTKFKNYFDEPIEHLNDIKNLFGNNAQLIFDNDIKTANYESDAENDEYVVSITEALKELLSYDSYEFLTHAKHFYEEHEDLSDIALSRKKRVSIDNFKTFIKGPIIADCSLFSDSYEEELEKYLSFKDDIHLILDIIKETDERLFEYKKMNNFFTFSDIQVLALKLLTMNEYEDVAEEVRSRFKYIMVDEYQDTNDFQEDFIESLLKPNKKGERSHLFCVGDAKQSIYAFRNSNVQLFRNRQNEYLKGPQNERKVIAMNNNYRSAAEVLDNINYIFKNYMTLAHGSISYSDEMEQLKYDYAVDLYGKTPYDGFGIKRIVSKSGLNDDYKEEYGSKAQYFKTWEAMAIINDIRKKVDSGYEVYDRSAKGEKKTRPCRYSDFAILTRTKSSSFPLYQSLFNETEIPLNVSIDADLNSIESVILLESIIKLINAIKSNASSNEKAHYFVSVARSYAYEYDDQKIYDLLNYDCNKTSLEKKKVDLTRIKEDPLWKDFEEFVKENENLSFGDIFLNLINKFHVIEKLNKIGDVADNIAKLESLYSLVLSKEESGEGLQEFVELLDSIDKYSLELSDQSVFQTTNAVDMMTIHASKGLERKIIYMPCSFNKMSTGGNFSRDDFIFDSRFGIQLPNYILPEGKETESMLTLPYVYSSNAPSENGTEADEHVRLFYVALTRAENSIYIVGDDTSSEASNIKAETLYGMLDSCPHYPAFDQKYLERIVSKGLLKREDVDTLNILIGEVKNVEKPTIDFKMDSDTEKIYDELYDLDFSSIIKNKLNDKIEEIFTCLYQGYINKYLLGVEDVCEIETLKEIYEFTRNSVIDDSGEEDEETPVNDRNISKSNEALLTFGRSLRKSVSENKKENDEGWSELGFKSDKSLKRANFIRNVVACFAKYKDNCDNLYRTSYATDEYKDEIVISEVSFEPEPIEDRNKEGEERVKKIAIKVDNTQIQFKERIKARASKMKSIEDEENEVEMQNKMTWGIKLHRILEMLDFKNPDLSYIKSDKERNIIEKLLKTSLMQEALSADEVYSEYGFFDEVNLTTGFIDLLFIKDGHYSIVDYKTKNIDDEAYVDQLRTYQRNIKERFDLRDEDISLYLLSIVDAEVKEITTSEVWEA